MIFQVSSIEYHMIVMKNVFAVNLRIHKKYDLKGSKVDRAATDKDPTLKDCDFLNEDVSVSYHGIYYQLFTNLSLIMLSR